MFNQYEIGFEVDNKSKYSILGKKEFKSIEIASDLAYTLEEIS